MTNQALSRWLNTPGSNVGDIVEKKSIERTINEQHTYCECEVLEVYVRAAEYPWNTRSHPVQAEIKKSSKPWNYAKLLLHKRGGQLEPCINFWPMSRDNVPNNCPASL